MLRLQSCKDKVSGIPHKGMNLVLKKREINNNVFQDCEEVPEEIN